MPINRGALTRITEPEPGYDGRNENTFYQDKDDSLDMRNLTFHEATLEQFKEFWERAGWVIYPHSELSCYAKKLCLTGLIISVTPRGNLRIHCLDDVIVATPATFGEALDAANELAGTKVFGGWA
jgi:hypothetical protein